LLLTILISGCSKNKSDEDETIDQEPIELETKDVGIDNNDEDDIDGTKRIETNGRVVDGENNIGNLFAITIENTPGVLTHKLV